MLVDIFARRYASVPLTDQLGERERRLLNQGFRILSDDLQPPYVDGKASNSAETFWRKLHDRLSRELGLAELWNKHFTYNTTWQGKTTSSTGTNSSFYRCKYWFDNPQQFRESEFKNRLSLIELGFRLHEEALGTFVASVQSPPEVDSPFAPPKKAIPASIQEYSRKINERRIVIFRSSVEELNQRFVQSDFRLHYHNGFIQFSDDNLTSAEIEEKFWEIANTPLWSSVDIEMKEALDRRDSGGRDPSFYAAKALESAIKIKSDELGITTGKEKGAINYIEALASKKVQFFTEWERDILSSFFRNVRNPFGHGAGSNNAPALSSQQTQWAIEFCMSFIKRILKS